MAITYQQKKLTVQRPNLSITGIYSPFENRFTRNKLGPTVATFKIISTVPHISVEDYQTITISEKEWCDLEEMYFLNIKNG